MKFSIRLTRCALGALAAVAVMSQAWAGPRLDHVLDTKTLRAARRATTGPLP